MPIDYRRYPRNWSSIRTWALVRADNRCEECGVKNGDSIIRSSIDPERYVIVYAQTGGYNIYFEQLDSGMSDWHKVIPEEYASQKVVRVVLTVAHLDHDIRNNQPGNLRVLCQLHHLRHDAKHHAQTRKEKRDAAHSGQDPP